jgi:membrane-bound ClpP family serine protease
MADGHRSKPTSWATVLVLIVAFVLFGFALPMQSVVLAVVGAVLLLAGLVMAVAFRIMEDYH